MMLRIIAISCLVSIFLSPLRGQVSDRGVISNTGYHLSGDLKPNDILEGTNEKEYFESERLEPMRIFLTGSRHTTPILGRIDFYNKSVQVDIANVMYNVDFNSIESVEIYIKDHGKVIDTLIYINSQEVLGSDKLKVMEVMVDGDMSLYKHRHVLYKRANYNKALDIGNKSAFFKQKDQYFYFKDSNLYQLPKLGSKKLSKVIADLFENTNYGNCNNEEILKNIFLTEK